jgi:hypothetical protein
MIQCRHVAISPCSLDNLAPRHDPPCCLLLCARRKADHFTPYPATRAEMDVGQSTASADRPSPLLRLLCRTGPATQQCLILPFCATAQLQQMLRRVGDGQAGPRGHPFNPVLALRHQFQSFQPMLVCRFCDSGKRSLQRALGIACTCGRFDRGGQHFIPPRCPKSSSSRGVPLDHCRMEHGATSSGRSLPNSWRGSHSYKT